MKDFQQVLFPVDFSPRCIHAVPYVTEIVRQYRAGLTLLHIVETPLQWYGAVPPAPPGSWNSFDWGSFEKLYQNNQESLTNFACEHFSELGKLTSVRTLCDRGDPGYGILAHAEKNNADLIMMPSHGYGPFQSFLLGSATTRVLHRAKCPVWTGAHLEGEAEASHAHIRNIVCALDLGHDSAHVVEAAVGLAEKFSAQVRLMHCVPVPETGPPESFASSFDRVLADAARDQVVKLQKKTGTDLEFCLEGGSVSKTVKDVAARFNADVVVIGRGHVHAPLSRLRSNAYAIIRNSPCPVLSL